MSLYDAAKDALKVAQKADNIELVQKLLDVQQQALEMQEKQFEQNKKIEKLERTIEELEAETKLEFEDGHQWLIDPAQPKRKYCPVCANRDHFKNVLEEPREYSHGLGSYCDICRHVFY